MVAHLLPLPLLLGSFLTSMQLGTLLVKEHSVGSIPRYTRTLHYLRMISPSAISAAPADLGLIAALRDSLPRLDGTPPQASGR